MTVLAFAAVAVRRTIRDRGNLFFLLVFPLVLIFLVGQQFGDESGVPSVGVVTPADGPLSAELTAALEGSDAFEVVAVDGTDELESDVAGGRLVAGVVLPEADADPLVARFVTGAGTDAPAVREVVAAALTGEAADVRDLDLLVAATGADQDQAAEAFRLAPGFVAPVTVETTTVGTGIDEEFAGASAFTIGASGQLLLFVFVTSLAGSGALIQARQWGVTRRALSAPIRARTVLVGEAAGRLAVALVQAGIIIVGTRVLYGVDWGNPLATGVVTLLFCLVASAAAMLLGAVASNDSQASGIGVVAGLGLAALGGSMLPLELFPDTLRRVAHITPHAWGIDALAEITRRDGTLLDVLPEIGVLAGFAAVLLVVASWRLRAAVVATGR